MQFSLKKHVPCLFIALAYSAGILVGCLSPKSKMTIFICLAVLSCALIMLNKNLVLRNVFVLILFILAGTLSMTSRNMLDADNIFFISKYYRGKIAEVRGVIISEIIEKNFFGREKRSFSLRVKAIKAPWGWDDVSGKILVNIFSDPQIEYGDEIIIYGKLHFPYEFSKENKFSYREYLKQKGIRLVLSVKKGNEVKVLSSGNGNFLKASAIKFTSDLKKRFYRCLTFNEAGVMSAILLGDRSQIPKHIRALFVRTGTVHILAISGLHTGIIAGVFMLLLNVIPFNRKVKMMFVCVLIAGYCFCTGSRPSVMRASFMIIVILLSYVFEKNPEPINTISLSALIILIYEPMYLFNIGFQLSYICVLSIILFSDKLTSFFESLLNGEGRPSIRFLLRVISVSCSVWLGVAGVIAYYFHMLTPVSIIANLFVVPMLSLVVVTGLIVLLFSLFPVAFVNLAAACLKILLNVMAAGIFLLDKIPLSCIQLNAVNIWYLILYYSVVLGIFLLFLFVKAQKT